MPTLQEELSTFKAIVRDIARHEMQIKDGKVFTAESRQQITRLANLGMIGNQITISGHCNVTEEERTTITEAILKQKGGTTAKGLKIIKDAMKSHKEEDPTGV